MPINPIMQSGISGVHAGLRAVNRAAQDIADLDVDERSTRAGARDDGVIRPDEPRDAADDGAAALIELEVHKRQVQASARVIETADEVLGFLLDIHA